MTTEEYKEQTDFIEAINGIIVNEDNKVLLVRRSSRRTFSPGKYNLIGGDILPGETPVQTFIRDAKEKLTLQINLKDVEFKGTQDTVYPNKTIRRYIFVYRLQNVNIITLNPKKYDEYNWYKATKIEKLNLTPGVKDVLTSIGYLGS